MSESSTGTQKPQNRKFSWPSLTRRDSYKDARQNVLESPQEGKEVLVYQSRPLHTGTLPQDVANGIRAESASAPASRSSSIVSFGRERENSNASNAPSPSILPIRLTRRRSSSSLTTSMNGSTDPSRLSQQTNGLSRVESPTTHMRAPAPPTVQPPTPIHGRQTGSGSFSKISLSAMIDALRGRDTEDRGRSMRKDRDCTKSDNKSASVSRPISVGANSRAAASDDRLARARSHSPFRRRNRSRSRASASVEALQLDDQSDTESQISRRPTVRPRNAFSSYEDDEYEYDNDNDDGESSGWSSADEFDYENEDNGFDPQTLANTEQNSIIPDQGDSLAEVPDPDPLGEGVNVIVPPEPFFPSSAMAANTTTIGGSTTRNPRRRKSTRHGEPELQLKTGRPVFQRDRCTITLAHGDPHLAVEEGGRKPKRYVTASDLSLESRYAIEWAVGTVLRDGDELYIVNVVETDTKIDPIAGATIDRVSKVRNQQERQALSYILVRQVTGLLQRTRLNVTVICQAWHAKNARHMLLDVVDYLDPAMLIVGSRGLGQIKGILLGSTSHYLIQKATVPVMVARRRLKRPPKRAAHLSTHRARVSLAEAAIDKVAPRVDADVASMRTAMEKEEQDEWRNAEDRDDENENENEDEDGHNGETETVVGVKLASSPKTG